MMCGRPRHFVMTNRSSSTRYVPNAIWTRGGEYDAEILQRRIQQYRKMRDMVTQMTRKRQRRCPEEKPEIELNIIKEVEEVDVDILKVIEIDEDPESSDESEESEGYETKEQHPNLSNRTIIRNRTTGLRTIPMS